MKFGQPAQVLLLSSLYTAIDAFPLLHFDQLLTKRAPQSYSVVAVDGGQPTGVSVQTVTDRVVQTSITTILSTIVVTQSDMATTVVLTSTAAVTITQAPVTISAPAETQTLLVGGSMTSSPYDNGMWHTTYYSSWTISPSVVSSSHPSSIVSTSTTILAGPAASTPISKADIAIAAPTLAATEKTTSKSTTTSAAAASTLVTTERVTSISATTLPLVATTPATTEKVPAGETTTASASAAAATTNWVTAYGQWHNHPNAEGSWWW